MDIASLTMIILGLSGLLLLLIAAYIYTKESMRTREVRSASSATLSKMSGNTEHSTPRESSVEDSDDDYDAYIMPDTKKLTPKHADESHDSDEETEVPINFLLEANRLEAEGKFEEAAKIYQVIGNIDKEINALEQIDPTPRLALLYGCKSNFSGQLNVLRSLLRTSPKNESIRLDLIKSLLLNQKKTEASSNLTTALEERQVLGISHQFFLSAGHLFKKAMMWSESCKAFEAAIQPDANNNEIKMQINYINIIQRMLTEEQENHAPFQTSELLLRIEKEDSDDGLDDMDDLDLLSSDSNPKISIANPEHEFAILVGHNAFGKSRDPKDYGKNDLFSSPIDRARIDLILSDRRTYALIQANDETCDFPIAIRLHRMFIKEQHYGLIRERLSAISALAHPNISKSLYSDRIGPVVRQTVEYHHGGSLVSMMNQLKQIGLPLVIRMMIQVTSGLVYCHSKGIVHGDVRAENIMTGHDQLVKIGDFTLQPWPVLDFRENPNASEFMVDIVKFGELLDHMLQHSADSMQLGNDDENSVAPKERVHRLAKRLMNEDIPTIAQAQTELLQILDLIMPQG